MLVSVYHPIFAGCKSLDSKIDILENLLYRSTQHLLNAWTALLVTWQLTSQSQTTKTSKWGHSSNSRPSTHNSFFCHQTEQAFEEYNLSFCTLVSLLVKASEAFRTPSNKKCPQTQKFKATSIMLIDRVSEYIIHRLAGTSVFSGIAVPMTPATYIALLPSIWVLISNAVGSGNINVTNSSNQHKPNEMFHAVLDHALKVSSRSHCKRPTVEFVARILLVS